MERPCDILVH